MSDHTQSLQFTNKTPVLVESWMHEVPPNWSVQPDQIIKTLQFRIGDRPVARSLRRLYELRGEKLPPELAALKGEVFVITHAFGLVAQKDANSIIQLGYRATFDGPGSTVDLFPSSRFKEHFSAGMKFRAGVAADGYATIPKVNVPTGHLIRLGAGAELQTLIQSEVVGNLELHVQSPIIQAIGVSAATAVWQFDKDKQPLVGDQVLVQTAVFPREATEVAYSLSAYGVHRPGFGERPFRFEVGPVLAKVELSTE